MRLLHAAAFALLSGCAYVGEPLPPALNVPRPVTAIAVEQAGDRIWARFALPVATTEALPLEIRAIELRAGDESIPAVRSEAGAEGSAPAAPWAGRRVAIMARVQSKQGKWSEWSPPSQLDVVEPVAAPAAVKAEPAAAGVKLSWRASARAGVAMRIERRTAAGGFKEAAVVEGTEWVDTAARFGEEQRYRLAAVAGPARSETVELPPITPEDRFAPSAPANLAAAPGLGSIELSWDRPLDADLAGFRIYRAQGAGEFARLGGGELTVAANYGDRAIQAGASYSYAVASVDRSGNESARSAPVEIAAPN